MIWKIVFVIILALMIAGEILFMGWFLKKLPRGKIIYTVIHILMWIVCLAVLTLFGFLYDGFFSIF